MTNTRITDPEIFEKRYPVLLREFSLRPGKNRKRISLIKQIMGMACAFFSLQMLLSSNIFFVNK